MKNKYILTLIVILVLISFSINILALPSNQGQINMTFSAQKINIFSPQNISYNFTTRTNTNITLNATAPYQLTNWVFNLTNFNLQTTNISSIESLDNYSVLQIINVTKGQYKLNISGIDINGQTHSNSVLFFVRLPNTAPVIQNISKDLFVCENSQLAYFFSSYDADGDTQYIDITPKSPFFIMPFTQINATNLISEIYSGILKKNRVGKYTETVSVSDEQNADTQKINITVIEVNNAPIIGNIGVQTVWLQGENSTFNKTLSINDTEDGQNVTNFSLTISFENLSDNLFNISKIGKMSYLPRFADLGLYNVTVCATDKGIKNPSPNISLCSQNGSNITTCSSFSLTVTNVNRPPTITNYWPKSNNNNLTIFAPSTTHFNISKYDPDFTIPDSYWYVDGNQVAYFSGQANDSFDYYFGCSTNGNHQMKVVITDGALNDSYTWSMNVIADACPGSGNPSGGGGGGACTPQLACQEWYTCQNAKKSLEAGLLTGESYRNVSQTCKLSGYDERTCGFQLRSCIDLNNCSKIISNQDLLNICLYTINPNCEDQIRNCHDNGCETLVDCGGPCAPCPTCSDKIKNQGEKGIDCGGPCPTECPIETKEKTGLSSLIESFLSVLLTRTIGISLLILIIIGLIIYMLRRIYLIKQEKKRIVFRYFRDKYD